MAFPTIAEKIASGETVTAYCPLPCGARRVLDLEALGRQFGFDFEVSHDTISHRLRCQKCGKLGGSIRLSPPLPAHRGYPLK